MAYKKKGAELSIYIFHIGKVWKKQTEHNTDKAITRDRAFPLPTTGLLLPSSSQRGSSCAFPRVKQ
jgi:hypothetical protein